MMYDIPVVQFFDISALTLVLVDKDYATFIEAIDDYIYLPMLFKWVQLVVFRNNFFHIWIILMHVV